ncbi:hypothetical protein EV682_10526 [Iodobacter fluviatilis]|uniref:Uncharacterized protein n=1 Tax=Iodobacter fluviatilis TaxID=537 RepID=A0A377Q5X9_9NEIS|nr:hypothetical protein EV682_10526 [Iodobacter fluviatilis]STQ90232.1 Uncharacterised protein [Iodobacter fluviatilis]
MAAPKLPMGSGAVSHFALDIKSALGCSDLFVSIFLLRSESRICWDFIN